MRYTAQALLGTALLAQAALAVTRAEPARIRTDTVLREVALVVAGKEQPPVKRRFDVVLLENRYLRAIVCPALGERILNVVDKSTGRRCFYEGLIRYSGSAYTEGGGSGGGLQVNHPLYHAGSSYVAPLPYVTQTNEDGSVALTMSYTSYPHLQHTVWQIRLRADEAAVRCTYRFENLAPYSMGFNPWISAGFPMADDAQFTLPAHWIAGHWFGINPAGGNGDWGHSLRPWPVDAGGVDQSRLRNRTWSAAFAYGLTGGFSGIHYPDANVGFAHVFDPAALPGAKAAGAWNTNGWLEVWGGFTHNMEDPRWLGPHESVTAEDLWFPYHGIGAMTWANDRGALTLRKEGATLQCGVYLLRDHGPGAVRVTADGRALLQTVAELRPDKPFLRAVVCPANTDEVCITVVTDDGETLLERREFHGHRPAPAFVLPAKPWHRQSLLAEARWQEAFTPLMGWGPWYHPPTTYAKALAENPTDPDAAIGLARSLVKEARANLFRGRKSGVTSEQQYAEAAALLATLPDPRAVELLAVIQFQTGKRDEAAKSFARLTGTPNDTAVARYHLGLLAAGAGKWAEVVDQSRAALALAPDSRPSRWLLAMALQQTGRPDQAQAVLAPLLEADPGDLLTRSLLRRSGAGGPLPAFIQLHPMAPTQHQAALAGIAALLQGQDLDPLSVDTTVGPAALPGAEP